MNLLARLKAAFEKLGQWLVEQLWHVLDIYHQLKPCRFSFIIAFLGGLVFLWADQGVEVLRALAERHSTQGKPLTTVTGSTRLIAFAIGMLTWCLASWYTARVLLYFHFPGVLAPSPLQTGKWSKVHQWLARNGPRILGAAPMWIVGFSLLMARKTYLYNAPKFLTYSGYASILAGCALWLLFYIRRRLIDPRVSGVAKSETANFFADYQRFSKITETGESFWILTIAGIVSILLLALFIINPITFAGSVGTGAVLAFSAATWIFLGSALVYLGARHRVPLLTLLAAWVAVCSLTNDNHDIRTVSLASPPPRQRVEDALREWHDHIVTVDGARKTHPLFIVTAEGGGIRAAYWTAAVLGSIQDADSAFADHMFAISGVSGGSVGAAVFDALLLEGSHKGHMADTAEQILGKDFLSPVIAALLYPDLVQRFWPWPCTYLDRGHWLEQSWEKAWSDVVSEKGKTNNRFGAPFSSLWQTGKYVPALFLNSTSVENGNRVIVSNLLINTGAGSKEEFLGAEDLTDKIKPASDVRLSTAAHLSARFTYVSPAARFRSDGTHAVDGGYFENSGATTGLDILREINTALHDPKHPELAGVTPRIIMISNSPIGAGFGNRDVKELEKKKGTSVDREVSKHEPGTFLEDALAPPYALLNARDARGVYAQRAIGRADPPVYFFSLAQTTVPLPLGWMLSNRAAEAIRYELDDLETSPDGAPPKRIVDGCGNPVTYNKDVRDLILAIVRSETD